MIDLKTWLLGSAAALASVGAAQAADLPVKKAVPVEFVRVCSAYGAGFFYIPGTDTCLRLSGRARAEYGYQAPLSRSQGVGDYSGYRGLARINLDARTQTGYGTLRAFLRVEVASRTGGPYGGGTSGTQQRIANAFPGLGIDEYGRAQTYVNADKAFVQFAGLTAGRASSFFDFYAHDFEFGGGTSGSDVGSTNLFAYTATLGNGFSATLSAEDPTARRTPIYTPIGTPAGFFGYSNSPVPVVLGVDANGRPVGYGYVDGIQRNRLPDFVGVLRLDQPWGSAQLSAAVHELNTGNALGSFLGTNSAGQTLNAATASLARTKTEYGWAVQGGVKVNAPFIAPGDAFYLQGAYAEGAQTYTGNGSYNGGYSQNPGTIQGASFVPYYSDATINPFTGQLQLSKSFTVVGSFLHYWTPEWRSAVFASYGENKFGASARASQGAYYTFTPNGGATSGTALSGLGVGTPGTRYYALNGNLRDTYMLFAGANLIWSPVKDLDIGVEGFYARYGVTSGRVLDTQKFNYSAAYVNNTANPVKTISSTDVFQARVRVQRDF